MHNFPSSQQLEGLANDLQETRPMPTAQNAEQLLVSFTRSFRHQNEALDFAKHIQLGDGQLLTGGHTTDSIGDLWWIGVRVANLAQWNANGGFHYFAKQNPEESERGML